jgi:hypothetical protein
VIELIVQRHSMKPQPFQTSRVEVRMRISSVAIVSVHMCASHRVDAIVTARIFLDTSLAREDADAVSIPFQSVHGR